jgi:dihydroorotase
MKLLISEAKILQPGSPLHGKICDLVIEDGYFIQISSKRITAPKGADVIQAKGLCISPGWMDLHACFHDPGTEHKEDINSGCAAAAFGGYTTVATSPATHPVTHSKSEVEYQIAKSRNELVQVLPIGAISLHLEGEQMAEVYDMNNSGAVAFSNGEHYIQNAGFMLRVLQYTKGFGGVVISRPQDSGIANSAQVNESANTTLLGLKGIPSIAEDVAIARDIELLRYTGGRLHIAKVSTATGVDLIRKAKKEKLNITCDVSVNNLLFTDADISSYDTNLKVTPPLRNASDRKALIKGLTDGTIDSICSDHQPQDTESKQVEFEYARYGAIGLQTCFAALNTYLSKELSTELVIQKLSEGARKVLNIDVPVIAEKAKAEFTLFDTEAEWHFTPAINQSKSNNSSLLFKPLKGKAVAVCNKGKLMILTA